MSAPLPRSRLTPRAVLLAPLRLVYALWGALVFLTVGLAALALLALLPGIARRRAAARRCARVLLQLAGMPVTLRHAERLPAGPMRGGVQPCQLPRRRGADRRAAAALRLRHQARDGRGAACRRAAAPPGLGVRRAHRPHPQRGGRATGAAQRHRRALAGVLPRGHLHAFTGAAEISYRGVRECRARRLSGGAGGAARHAPRVAAERRAAAPGAPRASRSCRRITPEASEPDAAAVELRDRARAAILERARRAGPHMLRRYCPPT